MYVFLQQTYSKLFMVQNESIADGLDLRGDNWQHRGIDTIEFIEAAPSSTLGEAGEDLTHSLNKTGNKRKKS